MIHDLSTIFYTLLSRHWSILKFVWLICIFAKFAQIWPKYSGCPFIKLSTNKLQQLPSHYNWIRLLGPPKPSLSYGGQRQLLALATLIRGLRRIILFDFVKKLLTFNPDRKNVCDCPFVAFFSSATQIYYIINSWTKGFFVYRKKLFNNEKKLVNLELQKCFYLCLSLCLSSVCINLSHGKQPVHS